VHAPSASRNWSGVAWSRRLPRPATAPGSVSPRATARHLNATIIGLKVMSKSGARPEALRDVAVAALDGMAPQRSGGPPERSADMNSAALMWRV